VIDATSVQAQARRDLVLLAREHDVLPVAIVLDLPERLCAERNAGRPDRDFGSHVIRRQRADLRRGLKNLQREGFRGVHVLRTEEEVAQASITRTRLYTDLRDQAGPFDVIGDVHGCAAELEQLLVKLGYQLTRDEAGRLAGARHPSRRAVFLGDLVDRGPDSPGVLRLVMGMVAAGDALCVTGNHEAKLLRALRGKNVQPRRGSGPGQPRRGSGPSQYSHGLAQTMEQLDAEPAEFRAQVERFIDGLISHYVLDGGRLVVAHAGLIERYQGRASGRVREFCLYGQTTGETDEYGLPIRYPWAQEYRGRAMVLYGHTPIPEPEWQNNTMCLDTGCVFGGRLTAFNYPERAVVSVPSARVYYPSARPFPGVPAAGQAAPPRREPDVLDIGDVDGTRVIETSYLPRVKIQQAHAAAALEVMSRFAIDPRWLVYLPPTMSPVATSADPDLLEHPAQAFDAYRADTIPAVLCERKHMGSRAILLIARTPQAAAARERGLPDLGDLLTRTRSRLADAEAFTAAYQRYCWDTEGLDGVRLAPFQLLATEGAVYHERPHEWHLGLAGRLAAAAPELIMTTDRIAVDVTDPASVEAGLRWWQELTDAGGEGMVVKPAANLTRGAHGFAQPGLKVRGREYLRLIYGPDYTEPANLTRLRQRGLGRKRSLALREYALGLEALDRLARAEPLWRIHECVFAVLALESEPVDPRL
jgi:protein phosphatase